jgi:hypothetical protein
VFDLFKRLPVKIAFVRANLISFHLPDTLYKGGKSFAVYPRVGVGIGENAVLGERSDERVGVATVPSIVIASST